MLPQIGRSRAGVSTVSPGVREIPQHHLALVPSQPVPHQDDVAPRKVTLERAQERDQREVVVASGPRLEVTVTAAAIPANGQRRRDRQARPVRSGVDQDRRVPARGPGTGRVLHAELMKPDVLLEHLRERLPQRREAPPPVSHFVG